MNGDPIFQHISMVSCQKGPTRLAYAWLIGPFWQDTLDICITWPWIVNGIAMDASSFNRTSSGMTRHQPYTDSYQSNNTIHGYVATYFVSENILISASDSQKQLYLLEKKNVSSSN